MTSVLLPHQVAVMNREISHLKWQRCVGGGVGEKGKQKPQHFLLLYYFAGLCQEILESLADGPEMQAGSILGL